MGSFLLSVIFFTTIIATLVRPWVGILAYYTLSLMAPQNIWPWIFGEERYVLYISIATIISFSISMMRGKIDLSNLRDKNNLYLFVLFLCIIVSYAFSPYGHNEAPDLVHNTNYLFTHFTKIFLFYFLSVLTIQKKRELHFAIIIIILVVIYYTYWANVQYLNRTMYNFGLRLRGPGPGGIYSDENCLAMLFVVGISFLYFMGRGYKNKIVKIFLLSMIPLNMHAVFLTGSQGGLIGLVVVCFYIAVRSKKKLYLAVVPIFLITVFLFQGGYLKERVYKSLSGNKATNLFEQKEKSTFEQRIDSWDAANSMILALPITGVGLGNFYRVYNEYSKTEPHVTHNTFYQFSSETGIISGIMYLLLFYNTISSHFKRNDSQAIINISSFHFAVRDSIIGGLVGFFVCSMFLNLASYEIFYLLLLINCAHKSILKRNTEGE